MIRYGILGFGLHAVRRLMPGFGMARQSTVTALYRRELGRARESAAEYKIAHSFDSPAELCRCPEVDAIFVTTPNCSHLEHVLLALDAGKPVLCEKPMGMNAGECRKMVDAARSRKVLLGVAHVFRFDRSIEKVHDRITAGQIGRPVFVRSEFSYSLQNHRRKWISDSKISGGGPIADVGVHCIDSLRYILEDEILRVHASAVSDRDSGDVEAAAALTLEFARGTLGSVLVSTRAEYRTPLEIVGQTGTLSAKDAFSVDRPVELSMCSNGNAAESEILSNFDAYARQVDAFSAAIEGASAFPVSGEDGWQNQEVLDAAYRSLKSGRVESVPLIRN